MKWLIKKAFLMVRITSHKSHSGTVGGWSRCMSERVDMTSALDLNVAATGYGRQVLGGVFR